MLKIQNLTKSFGSRKILDSIDLTLKKRKVYALLGSNGAGKTTVFNLINQFLKVDTGTILWNDQSLNKLAPYQINRLGIGRTFQDLRLINKLTVEENIRLAIPTNLTKTLLNAIIPFGVETEKKKIDAEVDKLLEKFYIADVKSQKASDISYGQQKLLTLACCVANGANLLLLDEPIAGIQPVYRTKIAELLKELRNKGKTIFLIEHHTEFLEEVTDIFFFLNNGKIQVFDNYTTLKNDKTVLDAYLG
jgi:branched-chain amino acid transport system ATP-binding protein